MMRKVALLVLSVLLLLDWAWAQKKDDTLILAGSTTVLPIAQRAAEEFMKLHPDVNISIRGGGSGVGIAALIDGTVDIANASRPIKTKELKKARQKGITPVGTVIAKDGIAVIVHPSNPLENLSLAQIRDIYTGKVSRWSEVGGRNKPIVVISRDVASGTFEAFKKLALRGGRTRPDALMMASNKAVIITVAKTPGAIGYVGLGYLCPEVKAIKVDGVYPSRRAVVSGEYKLARPLFMYTNGKPKGLAKELIDFILSPKGHNIVEELGFIPIK